MKDKKLLLRVIAKFMEIVVVVDYRIELCERGLLATTAMVGVVDGSK